MKRPYLLVVAAALLLTAVGLVVYGSTQVRAPRFTGQLADILPPAPHGWTKKTKPIADSPEMQEAVGELLNFDDGVFVDYINQAGERLSVYIAYWTPGKMSHRLVAGHTPDVCWVMGGWKKLESGPTPDLKLAGPASLARRGLSLPPGESRAFIANGVTEHVWFWHLVGDESISYATGFTPPWYAIITDLFSKGLNQREEQFFIRLSSPKPVKELMSGPVLPAVLERIPWPSSD